MPAGLKLYIVCSWFEVPACARVKKAVDRFHLICVSDRAQWTPLLMDGGLRARAAVAPWQNVRAASSTTPTTVTPVDIIAKKREGDELTAAEVHTFIQQFTAGQVADYQMAAWLMAVCLRGMTPSETAELTLAMVQSGSVADLSDIPGAKSGMRHAPEHLH